MKWINFKCYLVCLFLLWIGVMLFVYIKAQEEKDKFYSYVFDLPSRTFYTPFIKYKGFDMSEKEYRMKKMFESIDTRGFSFFVYEITTATYPIQLMQKSYDVGDITYLKNYYKEESYMDQEYLPEIQMYGYSIKHRKVIDNLSPSEIYQSCWEYYEKQLQEKGGKPTGYRSEGNVLDSLSLANWHYYGLSQVPGEGNFKYEKTTYGNEYYSVEIGIPQYRFEANFVWRRIWRDIGIYFLILSILPTILIVIKSYNKAKFLVIWYVANYLFLSLSTYSDRLNYYDPISIYSCEVIWPFTKKIVDFQEKKIYAGTDPNNGATIVYRTNETYLNAIYPLAGYDYTEFIVYCMMGYIIHLFLIKQNINKN